MQPLSDQIERLCASDTFRASPKLVTLLRFLAGEAVAQHAAPPSQRRIAADVLRLEEPDSRSAGAAVRMQVGRLRALLDRYYEQEGLGDEIRVELPLRDYRLRFLRGGKPITIGTVRTTDTPVLGVAPTVTLAPESADLTAIAAAFSRNLVGELAGHGAVTTIGPVAPTRRADGPADTIDTRMLGPASFVLDTAVQTAGDEVRVLASVVTGQPPRQIWAQGFMFPAAAAEAGPGMQQTARRLAAAVADECGVVVREILRSSVGKPVTDHTVVEAMMTMWRYWMTGSQDDLAFARTVLDHAVSAAAESPLALGFWAAVASQEYTSSLDPRARLPALVLERVEQARRHAVGMPWIELVRAYALWLARQTTGLGSILDSVEAANASATFRGMVGAMRIVTMIEPERGRRTLEAAIADSPQPLLWFHLCAAIHDFRQGDLAAAAKCLARIDAPGRPEPVVMQACVASRCGDVEGAGRILAAVTDVVPEFAVAGEVILRRWLHDSHVDAIAEALQPVGIDWFHAPRIGIVRG